MIPVRPSLRPVNPNFSSGPCRKRPGWGADAFAGALVGRSHRSDEGRARLRLALSRTRALLGLPDGFRLALLPGSDTGAFEACLWSMLGARPVTVLAWETFGRLWARDVVGELRLSDVRLMEAGWGALPDLGAVDFSHDVIFCANGTTSGVRVPNYDWIDDGRDGLTFVDATSAVFASAIDWSKVDVLTFSWQKALGGEAQHGMVVLSPRAVERLQSFTPQRSIPKLFRLAQERQLFEALFDGWTINTPSMLAVEDWLDALAWGEALEFQGKRGRDALMARTAANAELVFRWIGETPWVCNLAHDRATWSTTSVCLAFSAVVAEPSTLARAMAQLLADEGVAFDIEGHRDAPPGLRIWTGPTMEADDLTALLPWLDWAFQVCIHSSE